MEDLNLAREFKKVAEELKRATKKKEIEDLRNLLTNCTERDFHKLKGWALLLFDKNIQLQKMTEQLMQEKLIGEE